MINPRDLPSYMRDALDSFDQLEVVGAGLKPKLKMLGDYIHKDSLVLFPSERGAGKTLFGLQLCMAVARGFKTFCGEEVQVSGNTLMINAELGRDDIARRVSHLIKNGPEDLKKETPYKEFALTTRKSLTAIKDQITGIIRDQSPELVVLDNWTIAFREADSSDKRKVSEFMLELLTLKDQFRFAIVVIDHLKKGSSFKLTDSDLQSGSGAKSDLADQDMFLRKTTADPQERLFSRRKSRNAPEQPFGTAKLLRLNPETLWFESLQENVSESQYLHFENLKSEEDVAHVTKLLSMDGLSIRQISEKTGISKSSVHRYVSR